jgi:hypothetical protein
MWSSIRFQNGRDLVATVLGGCHQGKSGAMAANIHDNGIPHRRHIHSFHVTVVLTVGAVNIETVSGFHGASLLNSVSLLRP